MEALALIALLAALGIITLPGGRRRRKRSTEDAAGQDASVQDREEGSNWSSLIFDLAWSGTCVAQFGGLCIYKSFAIYFCCFCTKHDGQNHIQQKVYV